MTWRVTVDTRLCISSGLCLGTAPGRFRFDESQHSSPVPGSPSRSTTESSLRNWPGSGRRWS